MSLRAKIVNKGFAEGSLLISTQPISFFGGVDPSTGILVERNHPLEGVSVSKRILAVPSSKGSTVGSYVIYGLAKKGVAPLGIILGQVDSIITAGAILSGIPTVVANIKKLQSFFKDGDIVVLDAEKGRIMRPLFKE
jgi:predicted aconitase with swiveling domain